MKKTLEQQYKEETGLNAYEPNNMRPNIPEDVYVEWLEDKIEQLALCNVIKRFSSEGEILEWLYLNTPLAIKPKSKQAKTLLINPFTSNHAFEEVCKHLANKLYNAS